MRLKTLLKGALTSKPTAFSFRSWESQIVSGIDWFDPCGTNILLELRGIQISRVLPRHVNGISEEWISDKIRFSYDGLRRQRLTSPYLFGKKISWEVSFKFLCSILKKGVVSYKETGKFLSLSVSYFTKYLFGSFSRQSNDFRSSFLLFSDSWKKSPLLFLGVNPRIDSPNFHLKVRALSNKNDVFQWGSSNYWNFYYKHIGNQKDSIFFFFEGKHKLVKKNPFVFCQESFYSYLPKNLIWSENLGSLSRKEVNYSNFFNKGYVLYSFRKEMAIWLNNDEYSSDLFSVYYGHHGDRNVVSSDLVLPGSAPSERNDTFLSLFGFYKKLEKIVDFGNKNCLRDERSFLYFLYILINKRLKDKLYFEGNCIFKDSLLEVKKNAGISKLYLGLEQEKKEQFLDTSITRASAHMALISATKDRINYRC